VARSMAANPKDDQKNAFDQKTPSSARETAPSRIFVGNSALSWVIENLPYRLDDPASSQNDALL